MNSETSKDARIRELEIERERILEQRILNVEDLEQRIARAREILEDLWTAWKYEPDGTTKEGIQRALDALEGK